jgi:cytochrome c5
MKINTRMTFVLACGTAAAALIAATASLLLSQPAAATAQFAKDTGKSCGDCHTNPQGGGPLTPYGEAFKANGNKLPK